ncbi:uncharacterized protein LOC110838116 [Zootermopsis nevadensis]|uniref:Transmembrane protein n=1 Tax=Zootermopsis nevadensis TaxID=136037 RepID=A0A067QP96_ZOONE|nr:uncharacterized protein LOC110838116 [Zootermopsis nevadensis]KDR10272.1 hypothetical protein L798_15531 [Zootermopsis nevadensis]
MSLVMVNALHVSIAMITLHLMTSIALIYGSIMVVRQSLLPWIGFTISELIIVLASITVCNPMDQKKVAILLATGMFILFRLCQLVTVLSYYCQLNAEQGSSCISLEDQDATSTKAGYPQIPPPGKPSDV